MRAQIEETPRPPSAIYPGVSPVFEQVILKSMAKDREYRFQNAGDLRQALEGIDNRTDSAPIPAPAAVTKTAVPESSAVPSAVTLEPKEPPSRGSQQPTKSYNDEPARASSRPPWAIIGVVAGLVFFAVLAAMFMGGEDETRNVEVQAEPAPVPVASEQEPLPSGHPTPGETENEPGPEEAETPGPQSPAEQQREARQLANRALSLAERDREQALELARRAARLDASQPVAWYVVALVQQQNGNLRSAREAVERCLVMPSIVTGDCRSLERRLSEPEKQPPRDTRRRRRRGRPRPAPRPRPVPAPATAKRPIGVDVNPYD